MPAFLSPLKKLLLLPSSYFFLAILIVTDLRRSAFEEIKNAKLWRVPLLVSVFLVFLIFSGGMQWSGGIREMFLAVPQWISRNDSDVGHFKPAIYYTKILLETEPILLLGFAVALIATLLHFIPGFKWSEFDIKKSWGLYVSFWSLGIYVFYSALNYKTPWLILNITVPACFAAAWWLSELAKKKMLLKVCAILLIAASAALNFYNTFNFTFVNPYGAGNPFSYVHTSSGMIELVDDIEKYFANKEGGRVLIGTGHYWPLPYYLKDRKYKVDYQNTEDPSKISDKYDVVVINNTINWDYKPRSRRYYRLSDVQESYAYFRR